MVHVPYRGDGPALTDLLGGQVQVYVPLQCLVDRVHQDRQAARAGGDAPQRARKCCRTSRPWASSCRATRRAAGTALARPQGTPAEIIDKLNKEINAGLADPKMKARLADLGGMCRCR